MNALTPPPPILATWRTRFVHCRRTRRRCWSAPPISPSDSLKDEVLDTLARDLGRIEILLDAAKNKPRHNAAELRWLYEIVFYAKALAGTFDYPLISQIGDSPRCFPKEIDLAGPTRLAIVEPHVRAMSTVIRDGHTGDNDRIGHAILASLDEAHK